MPGISYECESGAHEQCAMGLECRCPHHQHTQELLRKGGPKLDPRGGVKRNVRRKAVDIPSLLPDLVEAPPTELHNTCPKCKERAKITDQFCRKDGTRLCMGKPCERCAAPCEEEDFHCWQCGWKLGDPMPVMETEIHSNGHRPVEDIKRELRQKMIEKGYPVPDTLV